MHADDPETRRRPDGLLVRKVENEILVLDTAADRIHQLNASAALIWELYDSGADVAEIANVLANKFDVDENESGRDVTEILTKFRALNLVT